ncbi:hypothetical protein C8034_v000661 [Colletotrichum sidae]|uniref:Uncharacterized protein n=1 Tax=Colletotrichum sidae TaxID=1347389 RepID=A0A4R8TFU6_9PEZI|nr:hypothetical protein C8034_v000661 [Colletotrichum sidae]
MEVETPMWSQPAAVHPADLYMENGYHSLVYQHHLVPVPGSEPPQGYAEFHTPLDFAPTFHDGFNDSPEPMEQASMLSYSYANTYQPSAVDGVDESTLHPMRWLPEASTMQDANVSGVQQFHPVAQVGRPQPQGPDDYLYQQFQLQQQQSLRRSSHQSAPEVPFVAEMPVPWPESHHAIRQPKPQTPSSQSSVTAVRSPSSSGISQDQPSSLRISPRAPSRRVSPARPHPDSPAVSPHEATGNDPMQSTRLNLANTQTNVVVANPFTRPVSQRRAQWTMTAETKNADHQEPVTETTLPASSVLQQPKQPSRKRQKKDVPLYEMNNDTIICGSKDAGNETSTKPAKVARRKRPLTEESRQAAATTRQMDDPNAPCLTCGKVDKASIKVIHRQHCIRAKLTEVKLSLPQDLGITPRWRSLHAEDVKHWSSDDVSEIQLMTRDLCSEPFTVHMRKFKPSRDENIHYWWTNGEGATERTNLQPYALKSIRDATTDFQQYVDDNAVRSWKEQIDSDDMHPLVTEHYLLAMRHYNKLDVFNKERQLLLNLFKLRFALRHSMNPSWIYEKNSKSYRALGLYVATHEDHPLYRRVPTPRMAVAQLHAINCTKFLDPLNKLVLHDLEKLYGKATFKSFFTVYVVTFLLLHELAAMAEQQKTGRAVFSGIEDQPGSREIHDAFLQRTRMNAEIMLLHWHYYKRAPPPASPKNRFFGDDINKGFLADVSGDQSGLYRKTWYQLKDVLAEERKMNLKPNRDDYANSLHWVSKMFVEDWSPEPGSALGSADGERQASSEAWSSPSSSGDSE